MGIIDSGVFHAFLIKFTYRLKHHKSYIVAMSAITIKMHVKYPAMNNHVSN